MNMLKLKGNQKIKLIGCRKTGVKIQTGDGDLKLASKVCLTKILKFNESRSESLG